MAKKLIILPAHVAGKQDTFALNYSLKNPGNITRLEKVLRAGGCNRKQALRLAKFPESTYYRMKYFHDAGLAYCETNGIDYRYTDYVYVIEAFSMLEEAAEAQAQELILTAIDHTKDVWGKDKDGNQVLLKKGNGELALKLAGKLSQEWSDKVTIDVDVGVKKEFGVTLNIIDFGNVIDIAADEQEELMKLTREKIR